MRLPILYTLTWPERFEASEKTWPRLDFLKMGDLTFKEPDHAKYPAMELAYAAGRAGGTMTGVCCPACCLVPYSICVVLAVVFLDAIRLRAPRRCRGNLPLYAIDCEAVCALLLHDAMLCLSETHCPSFEPTACACIEHQNLLFAPPHERL